MNIAHTIHTLEGIALAVPLIALGLIVLALSFGIAWRGKVGR